MSLSIIEKLYSEGDSIQRISYLTGIDCLIIKIDGKPITEQDILYLLSRFTGQTHDKDLEKVLDYWIMLKESGHNGFYLRAYHQDTTNKNEAIRIGSRHKRQKVKSVNGSES